MEFKEFLDKQEAIYSKFRDTSKIKGEGVLSGINGTGGYLIVFRHPESVASQMEDLSRKICSTAPSLFYDKGTVHSTISDFGIKPIDDFSPEKKVLDGLCLSIRKETLMQPLVKYKGILYNQTAVILKGIPDDSFLVITEKIIENVKQNGLELRLPWGAHTTIGRFTESRNPNQLADFFELMNISEFNAESRLEAIDVGHFNFTKKGLNLTVYERFKI